MAFSAEELDRAERLVRRGIEVHHKHRQSYGACSPVFFLARHLKGNPPFDRGRSSAHELLGQVCQRYNIDLCEEVGVPLNRDPCLLVYNIWPKLTTEGTDNPFEDALEISKRIRCHAHPSHDFKVLSLTTKFLSFFRSRWAINAHRSPRVSWVLLPRMALQCEHAGK